MQSLMTLVRALHYASLISLAGTLVFAAFVAEPAFSRHGGGSGSILFRGRLARLVWASVVLGLVTGLVWLIIEAHNMSGKPIAATVSQGIVGIVLARTKFGHDWQLRGLLAIPLLLCLWLGLHRRSAIARAAAWAALALSAAELAMIAGAGHAIAGTGWTGDLHLIGDGAHLLAAGAWVGGLVPLALFFAAAHRDEGGAFARAAHDATRRYSLLGILAVATLLVTGIINSVFLVGSIPALLGTDYGHLLMVKIALFLTMVVFAAINRQWLMPQLARTDAGSDARPMRGVLRRLQRNALIEACLGAAVLLVVGTLGTTPPALHVVPEWPLPFKFTFDRLAEDSTARLEAIIAGIVALAGLAVMLHGLLDPAQRTARLLAGLFVFVAVGAWPLQFMTATAYPTSFYVSAVPLTVPSILRGAKIYADNCVACHGESGHGDGPLAKNVPVRPADLTAAHIFEHSDGDLFWWIGNGIATGGMPGFAETLDARARWDVINFIHARAAGAQQQALQPQVTAGPAPPAPDFAFEQNGRQSTLRQRFERGPVLLIFYRLPQSEARLQYLAGVEQQLAAAGLHLLALPLEPAEEASAKPLAFAAIADSDAAAAYRLFMEPGRTTPCEFLIDAAGFLRARWTAAAPPIGNTDLLAQLDRMGKLPLRAQAHVHAH